MLHVLKAMMAFARPSLFAAAVALFCCCCLIITAGGEEVTADRLNVGAAGNAHDMVGGGADGRQQKKLIELNENNWQAMLKGEWMVEFFAPWCPACKNLAPTWERFAVAAAGINVNVAKIDVTTSPSLSGRFFVTALPTIYHVKNGDFRHYRGSRDGDALMLYIKHKQWQKTEPISAWKKPDTIHMSILSYFFKLSHTLKDFNLRLQDEFGMPIWGSYALFAIGTIFVGAALGLMLICVVDFLYPPKKTQRQSFSETKGKTDNAVEDLANDEIEDDEQEQNENDDDEADDNDDDEDVDDEQNVGEEHNDKDKDYDTSSTDNEPDEPESDKNNKAKNTKSGGDATQADQGKAATNSPTDVRKRKPRKAD